ncbi:hypothetical protein [Thermincola ferriacetica]
MTNGISAQKQSFFLKDLKMRLKRFIGKNLNVEFECNGCCKRAIGGVLTIVGDDFIELTGTITIVTLVPGFPHPIKKNATTILIPLARVCSIELV